MTCGSSSLLRRSGVSFAMAAIALVFSASAPAATPKPEPTPEAKAVPKPEPAPSARPRGSTTQRVAPRTRVRVTRSAVLERPQATRPATRSAAKPAAKPAASVRRSPARLRRGASPARELQPLVVERRAPLDPPLSFVSAPLVFPDQGGPALLAALALLALFAASASHLGLLYAVWKRVPG
jgi:hypothetical protein